MQSRRTNDKEGFTLAELLVVMAIISLISAIVISNTINSRSIARDSARASDVTSIQNGLNLYFVDHRNYPPTLAPLVPTYMSAIPIDPLTGGSYNYAAIDTNGNPSTCESYHVGAAVENSGFVGLNQDADAPAAPLVCTGSANDFNGTAANCVGINPGSPDTCFDLEL
jgi:prepilin-type N-terminal cleavage/methylation domain-containing protein